MTEENMESVAPAKRLRTFVDPNQMKKDLSFSDLNLSESFSTQASYFNHYAAKLAKAQYQADRMKSQLEILEARLNRQVRYDSTTKLSEKAIDSEVRCSTAFVEATQRLHEATMIAALCKSAVESFRHRRDMLVQAGADAREDRKGEMRMKGGYQSEQESVTGRMKNVASGSGK